MSHVTEKRTVTREEEVIIQVLCDCCGNPFVPAHDITREVRETLRYGGDGGTTNVYDVCHLCWKRVVEPLFKTGPRVIEW